MERRFLGVKELSEYLGIQEATVYSWVCYKKIPYLKLGRLVRFDLRVIEAWIKESAVAVMN